MTYERKIKVLNERNISKLILLSLHFKIEAMKDDVSIRHKTATQRKTETKQVVLDQCCRDLAASMKKNGGRKAHGMVSNIARDLKGVCPWINIHVIDFSCKKFIDTRAKSITPPVVEEDSGDVL